MSTVDDFLARCDDVLADWDGSADAAVWTADGSHEEPADIPWLLDFDTFLPADDPRLARHPDGTLDCEPACLCGTRMVEFMPCPRHYDLAEVPLVGHRYVALSMFEPEPEHPWTRLQVGDRIQFGEQVATVTEIIPPGRTPGVAQTLRLNIDPDEPVVVAS
jgi:hypothetical protein